MANLSFLAPLPTAKSPARPFWRRRSDGVFGSTCGRIVSVRRVVRFGFIALAWCLTAWVSGQAQEPLTGRNLFNRRWEVNDPLCPNGDGLGPCFNEVSCVACHHLAGAGGAGENEHNVDLLSVLRPPQDLLATANRSRTTPLRLHPDFLARKSTAVLHRFGTGSDYEFYRFALLGYEYSREMTPTERARVWARIAKHDRTASPVAESSIFSRPICSESSCSSAEREQGDERGNTVCMGLRCYPPRYRRRWADGAVSLNVSVSGLVVERREL
jgi:hypothetical protein